MRKIKTAKVTIEDLAIIVKHGFDNVDERFNDVDKRFDGVDKRFDKLEARVEDGFLNVNARLYALEQDVGEIRRNFVYRDEFEDLMARVKYLEKKLGIESGK